MTRRAVLVAIALASAACGADDAASGATGEGPARGGPARGRGAASESAPASAPRRQGPPDREAEAVREATRTPQAWGAEGIEVIETEAAAEGTAEGAAEGAAERPRDLGAELRAAIGTPAQCLDLETARSLGGSLRANVRVYVSATGRVTRAEALGSAPEAVRACIARIAEGVSLAGPIEDAPRVVSTELAFDVRADPSSPPPPEPAAAPPAGTRVPGIVAPSSPPALAE